MPPLNTRDPSISSTSVITAISITPIELIFLKRRATVIYASFPFKWIAPRNRFFPAGPRLARKSLTATERNPFRPDNTKIRREYVRVSRYSNKFAIARLSTMETRWKISDKIERRQFQRIETLFNNEASIWRKRTRDKLSRLQFRHSSDFLATCIDRLCFCVAWH